MADEAEADEALSDCAALFDCSALAAARLPLRPSDYATAEYWASRYVEERDVIYDWYGLSYATFWERHLRPLCAEEHLIVLEIGSGNSEWSSRMARSGLCVVSTDIDLGVLQGIATMDEGNMLIERLAVDARKLPFRRSIFDIIVDKGTLDALYCANPSTPSPSCEIDKLACVHTSSFGSEALDGKRTVRPAGNPDEMNTGRPTAFANGDRGSVQSVRFPIEQASIVKAFFQDRCSDDNHKRVEETFVWTLWQRGTPAGLIRLPTLSPCCGRRISNNILMVVEAAVEVMGQGGTWVIVTAKEPYHILENMVVHSLDAHGDEVNTENMECAKWLYVHTSPRENGIHVIKLTKL